MTIPTFNLEDDQSNEAFLEQCMLRYGRDILHFAYTYVRDDQLAEDITQEVFIKCITHLHQFRGDSTLKTWLLSITSNYCKDYLKSSRFKFQKLHKMLTGEIKAPNPTPEESIVTEDIHDKVTQAILLLPIKYREVIHLYYYEEMSIQEITTLLHINRNTVKTRLARAREKLKPILSEVTTDEQ